MEPWIWIPLIVIAVLAAAFFVTLLVCFLLCFYSPPRRVLGEGEYEFPEGDIYVPLHERMVGWMEENRKRPHENFEIKSHDGLTLRATYYEYKPGAVIELIFHGYRGNSERDLCAAVERCWALGRSVMLIDQRASGKSDGSVISFGINERRDAVLWARFAAEHFGRDARLMLGGVSMGAATAVLAAGEELPENVVCIMADCGYSSAKEIIKKVIGEMHLPPAVFYPLVRLAGKLFGGFDLEETSPIEALSRTKIPVIFIHGTNDDFVPHLMSEEMYAACPTVKKLVLIDGAGHGIAYPHAPEEYISALAEFERECGGFPLGGAEMHENTN